MRPHLHLLLPSSTSGLNLEARIYLPDTKGDCPVPLSSSASSLPSSVPQVSQDLNQWLESRGVDRLVTACHPWGKLGGSCLDPVIAEYLVNAVYPLNDPSGDPRTALLTWNVRGVGQSQGSMGIFGLNNQTNERDLQALEDWAFSHFSKITEYRRFGYSWGSWTALSPARPHRLRPSSVFLVSPPVSLFGLLSTPLFFNRAQSFRAYLNAYLSPVPDDSTDRTVIIAYGTSDEFTSASTYLALGEEHHEWAAGRLTLRKLEGAGHFYRTEPHAEWLTRVIRDWVQTT